MASNNYASAKRAAGLLESVARLNYFLGAIILVALGIPLYSAAEDYSMMSKIGGFLGLCSIAYLWFVVGTFIAGAGQALRALIAIAENSAELLRRSNSGG